jgi:pyruvate formate lyase activating enzyme
MQPALYYRTLEDMKVQCQLCPHQCTLSPGRYGKCNTRINRDGKLYTESYGILSAISSDPVEKKPLYHFFPGHPILSIGSFGCNFACDFCQNCDISQITPKMFSLHPVRDPWDIVGKALLTKGNIGLAYTYNEPSVYYEFMLECAVLIKEHQRFNVMVTNGYLNRSPLEELLPYMDAFNVDLKSFRDEFYQSHSKATLRPVLDTISRIAQSDRHLELTFLIIPGLNDSEKEWEDMVNWIVNYCGPDSVLHVSRYFPKYKLRNPPTPLKTLQRFIDLAGDRIRYLYPGNTPLLESHTYCPECHHLLIKRNLYHSDLVGMGQDGRCDHCHTSIYGVFQSIES